MAIVYCDIETIPGEKMPSVDLVKAPAQMKKRETIEKWLAENGEAEREALWRKESFVPEQGRIICIGIAIDDGKPFAVDTVEDFYESIPNNVDLFVGHNFRAFDAPFIYKHAIRSGINVKIGQRFRFNKFRGNIADTMELWGCDVWGSKTKLDTIARFLGVGHKTDGIDGSRVFDYWRDGRVDEIKSYCCDDVELTRAVYKRIEGYF